MEQIHLTTADGGKMRCLVARPKGKVGAAMIVLQEAFGVNHHMQEMGERFAAAGYLSIVPELFHRSAPEGFTVGYNEFEKVKPHFAALTEPGMQDDVRVCYEWLTTKGQAQAVASVGYCLGGRVSFLGNAAVPLKAAVSYYGGGIMPTHAHLVEKQNAPLLFFWGGQDTHIPNDQIQSLNQKLTAANKKFSCVQISDAGHGFSCDERPSYNAVATRQAWALTLQFLREYNHVS